ncbi:uncharacterized protein SCHCODRAFT_02466534, partial [Schizophyllum commune H4-8]
MLRQSPLKGIQIPGAANRLIASLFADDTTTYLAKTDTWGTLWCVLKSWCKASLAKFNDGKTELIPIGSEEHRARVIATRKLGEDQEELPTDLHIAQDAEPIRSLGAWVGNKIKQAGIWSKQIERSHSHLTRAEQTNPSMEGRKHMNDMYVRQTTEYLCKVQGMPKMIETMLDKMANSAFW